MHGSEVGVAAEVRHGGDARHVGDTAGTTGLADDRTPPIGMRADAVHDLIDGRVPLELVMATACEIAKNAAWVRSLADRIERAPGDAAKVMRDAATIRGFGRETEQIAHALLDRIERAKQREAVYVDFGDVVDRVSESVSRVVGGHPLELEVPAVASEARVRRPLHHALLHLVDNAVRASEPGVPVVLRARVEAGWLGVDVIDAGVGMSGETLARCRELGFTTRGDEAAGGVGLAIAEQLIAQMGGELAVESSPRRGTRVRCRLPAG